MLDAFTFYFQKNFQKFIYFTLYTVCMKIHNTICYYIIFLLTSNNKTIYLSHNFLFKLLTTVPYIYLLVDRSTNNNRKLKTH